MAFLNISNKNKAGILKQIDSQNYLGLFDCSRLELYNFMVALGYRSGYATDFEGSKESFVRGEYVNNIKHAFSALYFEQNPDSVEEVSDTDKVYSLADKYANTGFSVISDYMKECNEHTLTMKLMAEMDSMYEEIKSEL